MGIHGRLDGRRVAAVINAQEYRMAEIAKLPGGMTLTERSLAICEIIVRSRAYPEASHPSKPIFFRPNASASDRVCMTCRGFGEVQDMDEGGYPTAIVECWKCGGTGLLP